MKKLLLVCCFVIGATAMSFAQGGGGRGMMRSPEEQAKALQTQLSLNDDQTAKITAIYKDQATKRDSVMKANNGDRRAAMQTMRPMMEATNTKIKAVLTADQAAAYEKWQKERMERMRNGGGMGGNGDGGNGGGTPPPPSK